MKKRLLSFALAALMMTASAEVFASENDEKKIVKWVEVNSINPFLWPENLDIVALETQGCDISCLKTYITGEGYLSEFIPDDKTEDVVSIIAHLANGNTFQLDFGISKYQASGGMSSEVTEMVTTCASFFTTKLIATEDEQTSEEDQTTEDIYKSNKGYKPPQGIPTDRNEICNGADADTRYSCDNSVSVSSDIFSFTQHTVPLLQIQYKDEFTVCEKLKYGDINFDGSVDLTDLTLLSLHLMGDRILTGVALHNANVYILDYSDEVDIADLAYFKQFISKDPKAAYPGCYKFSEADGH